MTTAKTAKCPACWAKGITCVPQSAPNILIGFGPRPGDPLGPCGACGWCSHTSDTSDYTAATGLCEWCKRPAVRRRDLSAPEHLPRPRDMGDEEFAFRAGLFVLWKTRPASELVSQFAIFADWLADRGSAEEVAARADWQVYAAKKSDPARWWQWTAPVGEGWVKLSRVPRERQSDRDVMKWDTYIDFDRARLTKSMHNGRWLLCWPPGFVRFTAPLSHDPRRWRVTVVAGRLEGSNPSGPVERVWPGGYSQLLAPYSAPALDVPKGLVVEKEEDLGLFAECSEDLTP